MIIGYNFFNLEEGGYFDTPICTEMLDELRVDEGEYDEIYIDLNTDITETPVKPSGWGFTTIMDSKFDGDLDAGSLGLDGFKVTQIQVYRSLAGTGKWDAIAQFDYNPNYNLYDYTDRYVQNGAKYLYGIVPVANTVIGEMLTSNEVQVEYEGIFLTDRNENRRLTYDISLGEIIYNNQSSINQPINSMYPIAVFGNSRYRSGNLTFLPLSQNTINLYGSDIDKFAEQINRQEWIEFLNNGRAKVLRMDNGVLMLVVTQNARMTPKEGNLRDLANISFDYVEIGDFNFDVLIKNNLISNTYLSKMTYTESGGIDVD